ncbi:adaptin ear-binding coat-associated protein 2-like isoform X1 [Mobula birostris]|uniref:adaptin ear-binding coat-associated protein 2-like isoform X1 n=1 Tax=Mobula birostris TaxID=1983395 RepID=UPI003B28C4CB
MAEGGCERLLCLKDGVKVFRVPPRATSRGHRASDWNLDRPDWTGRLRMTGRGDLVCVRLEDRMTGELFAEAPIDTYPGIALESVTDSSRYFVLRIQDGTGRTAFIGVGFSDRGDAFDFNVALQDHFRSLRGTSGSPARGKEAEPEPSLDLGFKEGETIELHIESLRKGGRSKTRSTGGSGCLAPLPPPPCGRPRGGDPSPETRTTDVGAGVNAGDKEGPPVSQDAGQGEDLWEQFGPEGRCASDETSAQTGWVQF